MIDVIDSTSGENWAAYHADCVHVARQLPNDCIDFSVYSPPFGDLFVYSDSVADMGNCADDDVFFEQYRYLVGELLRIVKPGRLVAVHCSDIPRRKFRDGVIGLRAFSDEIRAAHESIGWIYHCRVTIWRDPVVEMQRTKALGLLHKQLKKDSSMSRTGLPDYVLVFRKPGDNAEPVSHTAAEFPVEQWQQWASPVWMDIDQTDTLNVRLAREQSDCRHLCALQLPLIARCITLWSNPGDTVFSPFMGIGSEGVVALKAGRKFIGVELKESYWRQACDYLTEATAQRSLFPGAAA